MLWSRLATAECSEGTEYRTVWAALLLLCQQKYQVTTLVLLKAEVKSRPDQNGQQVLKSVV